MATLFFKSGKTLFRVHGSMLARHSDVFRDMLSIPQPPVPQGPMIEDCPVVHLSDAADDVERLLSIFYDNLIALDARQKLPFSLVRAMLRLGKKYEIGYLYKEGLKTFRHDCPTSLSDWDPYYVNLRIESDVSPIQLHMVNLAHELSLKTVLPSLYLDFLTTYDVSEMIQHLDAVTLETMMTGRERLVLHLQEQKCKYLKQFLQNKHPDSCRNSVECKLKRVKALEELSIWHGTVAENICTWAQDCQELKQICFSCRIQIRIIFNNVQADTWGQLPDFFGLGDWEDLEDDNS